MNLNVSLDQDVLVISPQKSEENEFCDLSQVKTQFMRQRKKSHAGAILDLSGVEMLNSASIGALVGILRYHQQEDCRFCLTGLQSRVLETLNVVNLLKVLPFRTDLAEGIKEMLKSPPGCAGTTCLVSKNPSFARIKKELENQTKKGRPSDSKTPAPPTHRSQDRVSKIVAVEKVSQAATPPGSAAPPAEKSYVDSLESNPHLQNWFRALQIFLEARELSTRYNIEFTAETTFKEFLSQFAEHLGKYKNTFAIPEKVEKEPESAD